MAALGSGFVADEGRWRRRFGCGLELQPEEGVRGKGDGVGLVGDWWEGDVAQHLDGYHAGQVRKIEQHGLREAGEVGDAKDGFIAAIAAVIVAYVGKDFAVSGSQELECAAAEDTKELAEGDHVCASSEAERTGRRAGFRR